MGPHLGAAVPNGRPGAPSTGHDELLPRLCGTAPVLDPAGARTVRVDGLVAEERCGAAGCRVQVDEVGRPAPVGSSDGPISAVCWFSANPGVMVTADPIRTAPCAASTGARSRRMFLRFSEQGRAEEHSRTQRTRVTRNAPYELPGRVSAVEQAVVYCRLSFSETRSRSSSYSSRSLRHSVSGGRGMTMPAVTTSSGPNCSRVRSISMPMPRRFHQW